MLIGIREYSFGFCLLTFVCMKQCNCVVLGYCMQIN